MERESKRFSEPVSREVSGGVGRHSAPRSSSIKGGTKYGPNKAAMMTRQPVVWIVNLGAHDYKPAEEFGRTIPLTTDNVNNFNLNRLMLLVAPRLRSASEDDYLLISGSPIVNAIITSMWLTRFSKVQILQFSSRAKMDDGGNPVSGYVPLTVTRETMQRLLGVPEQGAA